MSPAKWTLWRGGNNTSRNSGNRKCRINSSHGRSKARDRTRKVRRELTCVRNVTDSTKPGNAQLGGRHALSVVARTIGLACVIQSTMHPEAREAGKPGRKVQRVDVVRPIADAILQQGGRSMLSQPDGAQPSTSRGTPQYLVEGWEVVVLKTNSSKPGFEGVKKSDLILDGWVNQPREEDLLEEPAEVHMVRKRTTSWTSRMT